MFNYRNNFADMWDVLLVSSFSSRPILNLTAVGVENSDGLGKLPTWADGWKKNTQTHYVWFSQFWSHFQGTMYCLPQRLKSILFEIFSNEAAPKGPLEWEKISNNVDFSLWGNHAATQNTFFDVFKWNQNHENYT